ncbi:bromodomain-containing protein 4-like [Photinus pyralis]|nr:bromodomain-containing protein 4-like [Photinus pyralis]XP_031332162.1 bromodomain-containing protein 4-like [Photinus pyralis]XP_031339458.1 bromodomain-containing protein 4-like [Photinus pyralis]XP_031339465.1 bromodomain-containing protein 4-like [Photinus pyralis]XP_031339473.1 bromodomain-containing protein 4-like [Photinus pyralis]
MSAPNKKVRFNSEKAPSKQITILEGILTRPSAPSGMGGSNQHHRQQGVVAQNRPPTPAVISLADSDVEEELGRLFENITPVDMRQQPPLVPPPLLPPPQQFGGGGSAGKNLALIEQQEPSLVQEVRPQQIPNPAPMQQHPTLPPQQPQQSAVNRAPPRAHPPMVQHLPPPQQQQLSTRNPQQTMALPPSNLREFKEYSLQWIQELHACYKNSEVMLTNRVAQLNNELFEANQNLEGVRENIRIAQEYIRRIEEFP